MIPGYQTLTEKEKQTLRLLVVGYDAKSMARHLGLSVHTINERLRDARRKMATSSSREAARLLREVEAEAPQMLGDKHLGDARVPATAQVIRQPAQGSGSLRRTDWIVGGFIVMLSLALLALSALTGPSQTPASPVASAAAPIASPAAEQAAVDAARHFLALLDRDDWAASWAATHQSFKLLNTVEWWSQASIGVRGRFGTIKSRELTTVDFVPAPPHGYWTVKFRASYTKQAQATETLSLAAEDGVWKVVGITIE